MSLAFVAAGPVANVASPAVAAPVAQLRGSHIAAPEASSSASPLLAGALAGVAALTVSGARTTGRRSAVSRAAVAVSVGQKVSWKGKSGTVQHFGPVDFAAGEWVGIALDEPAGLHDGSVFGKSYFSCAPKHGVFCSPADIGAGGAAPAAPAAPAPVAASPMAAAPAAVPAAAPAGGSVSVGQKVNVRGQSGTVQFVGKVSFGTGEWVGVQLDQPNGMHDGSVFGVQYFSCPPKTGVFCTAAELGGGAAPAPVAAPMATPVAAPAAMATPAAPAAAGGAFSVGQRVSWSGKT
eukprot:CAMPEP_0178415042 /NCGR_PEP_ID=MMETSP0689_2-20121128/23347_1 /TAXON_ID=160604 /ORGANISM="Amphidinium massartii, Strain CS-259" /LENGTH=291 /DNA_ID=CAMNT_0020036349 /DNA_START=29 /DNA_END=901 /DNA_ORIENTATION=+